MNYIKHLTGFFDKVMRDERLNPTHISLYVSLFQFWNVQRFKNPISISRDEVMRVSKICSKATYHKCMRDLHNFSYLNYDPSFNPFRGSLVTLFNLELTLEQLQKKGKPKILPADEQVLNEQQTSTKQDLVSSINNTNLLNNSNGINGNEHSQKNNSHERNENSKNDSDQSGDSKKEKSSAKKEKDRAQSGSPRPLLQDIKDYFTKSGWPVIEAEKFYNHYESNGWLVGGKTPMVNWQASANNWILNSENFTDSKTKSGAGKLHTSNNKDYAEPL